MYPETFIWDNVIAPFLLYFPLSLLSLCRVTSGADWGSFRRGRRAVWWIGFKNWIRVQLWKKVATRMLHSKLRRKRSRLNNYGTADWRPPTGDRDRHFYSPYTALHGSGGWRTSDGDVTLSIPAGHTTRSPRGDKLSPVWIVLSISGDTLIAAYPCSPSYPNRFTPPPYNPPAHALFWSILLDAVRGFSMRRSNKILPHFTVLHGLQYLLMKFRGVAWNLVYGGIKCWLSREITEISTQCNVTFTIVYPPFIFPLKSVFNSIRSFQATWPIEKHPA